MKPKRKVGRKPLLNKDLQKKIVALLQQGHTIQITCNALGVSHDSFYVWMRRGEREGKGMYFQFFDAVTKSRGIAEVSIIDRIQKSDDWRAQAWLAERMFPDRYGTRERLDVNHKGSIEHKAIVVNFPEIMSAPRIAPEPKQIKANTEPNP